MLFLPILGPAFGLTSAIEGLTLQGKKMNRHFDGVDFTIIIAGGNKPDRTTLLQTYCACPVRIFPFLLPARPSRLSNSRFPTAQIRAAADLFKESHSEAGLLPIDTDRVIAILLSPSPCISTGSLTFEQRGRYKCIEGRYIQGGWICCVIQTFSIVRIGRSRRHV